MSGVEPSGSWVAWLLWPLLATTVRLLLVVEELPLVRRAAEEEHEARRVASPAHVPCFGRSGGLL